MSERLIPGLSVVRALRARLLADLGVINEGAVAFCERNYGVGSRPAMICRAAVPAATMDSASAITDLALMAAEFIEAVRPATILGRLQGVRRVPANVRIPRATAGATVAWVGEASVTPLSAQALDQIELDDRKIAGIIAVSTELLKLGDPAAEGLIRNDLIAAVAALTDRSFLDPSQAGEAGVSPASITYGAATISATGTNAAAARSDIARLVRQVVDAGIDLTAPVLVMKPGTAIELAALDGDFFSQIGAQGGQLGGIPVLTTNGAPADGNSPSNGTITLIDAAHVNLADPGAAEFDTARHASLQLDSSPDSPPTASTVPVSLWQHGMVGIKVKRFINWKMRRPEAVAVLDGVQYTG